jgi:hypothetical protein
LKFFSNVHAAIDYPNDRDLVHADDVKYQIKSGHDTPQTGIKTRTLAANERKSGQIFEVRINSSNERVGRLRTPLFDVVMDVKQISFGFVGNYDSHPATI